MSYLRGFFKSRSLSFRLFLVTIPVTILAISLLGYLDDHAVGRMLDEQVTSSSVRLASQLADDLSRNQMLDKVEDARKFIGELVEANFFITRIDIYRVSGDGLIRILTTSTSSTHPIHIDELTAVRQGRPLVLRQYQEGERLVKAITPILIPPGGQPRGCVTLVSSLRESDLVKEVHYRIALFLIPAAVAVLIVLLHLLFTREVTRRIDRVVGAMTGARAGELQHRIPVDSRDEIGIVAQGFNEMMDEIERTSRDKARLLREQEHFNVDLQKRVADATRDLSSANERLRELNEDLVDAQRRVTQAERTALVGYMAATFAHEIGSPLSAMSTHLQLMAEDPGITPDTARRLDLVQQQLSRITWYVEELLSETRAPAQSRAAVQVNDLLRKLLLFLEHHLGRRGVSIVTDFAGGLPALDANSQELQQVFLNLLNNAGDAMPKGGTVVVTTRLEEGPDASQRQIAIGVSDNGTGIPAEKQARIFEPFFSTKALKQGTGLGLTIAAKIIRQHHGKIEVRSAPGQGTTVTVRLPVPGHTPQIHADSAAGKEAR
jgi:two-component system, NtrC family, sensor kinase